MESGFMILSETMWAFFFILMTMVSELIWFHPTSPMDPQTPPDGIILGLLLLLLVQRTTCYSPQAQVWGKPALQCRSRWTDTMCYSWNLNLGCCYAYASTTKSSIWDKTMCYFFFFWHGHPEPFCILAKFRSHYYSNIFLIRYYSNIILWSNMNNFVFYVRIAVVEILVVTF